MEKRNPTIFLPLSLRFAKEYLVQLCEIKRVYSEAQIQQSKELTIIHRALWTALVVEVRKMFDNSRFDSYSLKKIDFFQKEPHKSRVDRVYGDRVIQKIIKTGHTFTVHLGKNKEETYSTAEICNSNLEKLFTELKNSMDVFERSSL